MIRNRLTSAVTATFPRTPFVTLSCVVAFLITTSSCPAQSIVGIWIRESSPNKNMVMEISEGRTQEHKGVLLWVPEYSPASINGFAIGDSKLKRIIPSGDHEYEGETLSKARNGEGTYQRCDLRVTANGRFHLRDTDGDTQTWRKVPYDSPDFAYAAYGRAIRALQVEDLVTAKTLLRKAAEVSKDAAVLNGVAWILATSKRQSIRDSHQALQLARKVDRDTGAWDPSYLDTLAAALAANGRFDEAIAVERKSVDIVDSEKHFVEVMDRLYDHPDFGVKLRVMLLRPHLQRVFHERLALYKAHTPYVSDDSGE